MTYLRRAFLTCLAVLLFAAPAFSDNGMGSLRIVVKDINRGTPIEGAQVLVTPCDYTGTTDSRGEVLLDEVTPFRNYQVDVTAEGYVGGAAAFVHVDPEGETVSTIPLTQKATLFGRVTMHLFLGFIRWPLKNAEVKIQEVVDKSFVTRGETQTDIWGRYTFENLDEGAYRITGQAEGFTTEFIDIEVEGGTRSRQNLSLKVQRDALNNALENQSPFLLTDPADQLAHERYLSDNDKTTSITDTSTLAQLFFNEPEAVPSVIPGPSELPYLSGDNQIFTNSTGSRFVEAGTTVYLRGFAVDKDIVSPQEFNPDAPCFDIYENKNGNFAASLFGYLWTLQDESGTDYTSLLNPSSTSANVSFQTPADSHAGDTFIAALTVTDDQDIESTPGEIIIVIAEPVNQSNCADCHRDIVAGYGATAHARVEGGAGCQDCHGVGSEHPDAGSMTTNYWSGVCGQCHMEFAELQKSNHSDPLPFGHYEPEGDYLTICYPCHYTPGYIGAVESGKEFHLFSYEPEVLSEIPKDTPNVSCSVCHDPHSADEGNPYGLRTGSTEKACDTCHHEKWQNALLEGLAGTFGNGYHYPGEDYASFSGEHNPHRTEDKCVLCHMDTGVGTTDEHGVLAIGGHTFRMRDFGDDSIPGTDDDTLNKAVCQGCHGSVSTFDINGAQTEVQGLLSELETLLTENNYGFLPANEPGNCARCHKGGTVPFRNDTDNILENAYTNYKLIANDRSRGVHNPGYIKKLLQDSIDSINNHY
jgi:hypothetical protein